MWRGTNCMERPYWRLTPEPRVVHAPEQPGEGGRARTPRERERTHTQRARGADLRGDQTEPAERTDGMEWRSGGRGEGTPGWDDVPHTPRGAPGKATGRGRDAGTSTGPNPPRSATSAAQTRPGHCIRQRSSGTQCHAPARQLGSLRASPGGSHWRQASSTGPPAQAPRTTKH